MVLQVWTSNRQESQPPPPPAPRNSSIEANSNNSTTSTAAAMPTTTSPTRQQTDNAAAMMSSADSNDGAGLSSSGGGHQSRDTTKKKKVLSLGNLKAPFKFMGSKTYCKGCKKKCSGEVLRVNDQVYFHPACFRCHKCQASLSQGGFFTRDKDYYCSVCYQNAYGTKCAQCGKFVEGEVVSALGKTYHQGCFSCSSCSRPFPTGERVTFTGKECLCQKCVKKSGNGTVAATSSPDGNANRQPAPSNGNNREITAATPSKPQQVQQSTSNGLLDDKCAGCSEDLKDGQALMALDKQYHVWCFKCRSCQILLHGEYMGKDGHPYCERDYQKEFGVKCTYCRRFISGKVLQAGDNNHFHPTCARCTKCGEPFGDGEEMFLQGAAIWHPRCGPGPEDSSHYFVNGYDNNLQHAADPMSDRTSMASGPAPACTPYYGSRASSPGASLMRSRGDPYYDSGRFSRSTMHVSGTCNWYPASNRMYSSSSTYSLRRPIEPGDRVDSVGSMNHFHLPPSRRASSSSRYPPPPSVPVATSMQQEADAMAAMAAGSQTPVPGGGGMVTSSSIHRPISCPPKPGYTHSARASTLPAHMGSAISPGPGMHFNDFGGCGRSDDVVSQQSFATDRMTSSAYGPRTSSYASFSSNSPALLRTQDDNAMSTVTPVSSQRRNFLKQGHHYSKVFTGEHKVYPLHVLFTTNYKLPPDLDRCNLEKHLSDADFEMAFNMPRDDFYRMPAWKKNEAKRRVRMF